MENKPDHWARVASADLEHVRKSVSDMFKSHQLKQLRADQTLQTRLRHAQFGQVALSRLGYGADVHIQPDHLAGFYLVQMPQYGTAKIRCGGQTVDSSPYAATILNPNEDVDMVWHANNEQLMLKIDRNLVERLPVVWVWMSARKACCFRYACRLTPNLPGRSCCATCWTVPATTSTSDAPR